MRNQSDIPTDVFVSPSWVRLRFGISNSTLYNWIAAKHLPTPIKIGPRAVRFRLSDILQFEAERLARGANHVAGKAL